jgi:hypothetical protein
VVLRFVPQHPSLPSSNELTTLVAAASGAILIRLFFIGDATMFSGARSTVYSFSSHLPNNWLSDYSTPFSFGDGEVHATVTTQQSPHNSSFANNPVSFRTFCFSSDPSFFSIE